ncbi:MAG: DUF2332 family protein [Paracoccus sp. (in: a-proteobacteria)]|nr:DUF2332 family protein [Paracoccus sp. (in: a-proteobacteria)]MDO5621293.1 DUF2332 family protein [Paracoccus sp. (in: a-proteobacteria)]
MSVREAFAAQARSCRSLGSELTARVCQTLGLVLNRDQGPVARQVLDWPGDTSSAGDSVPLRLAGALHALVLQGSAPVLARAYQRGDVEPGLLLETIATHQRFVLDWLDSPPQTNETGRAAAIIAAARFLGASLPLEISELGASAGLNLNWPSFDFQPQSGLNAADLDIYRQKIGVILRPDWRGKAPPAPVEWVVAEAAGVDLNPLDPSRDELRLLAYCWPDQPARLARLRAALALAQRQAAPVRAGDAAQWLGERLARPAPGRLRFVYHTIAWQYFPPETQARCEAALQRAGAAAMPEAPLAHFGMEADGAAPGAGLRLRLWNGAAQGWDLGRADFHGRWIDWRPVAIDPAQAWP